MNRHDRRKGASLARQEPVVSIKLLQRQFDELAEQAHQMRNVLFALVKDVGRVRVALATINGLMDGDHLDAHWEGDQLVVSFVAAGTAAPEESA